jgi:hypothetical protein
MEIKKIGKVYKFDKDDYLIAKQDKANIQSKWLEVVNYFIDSIDKQHVHSIYLRGSVITGEAFDHISDIDFIMLSNDLPKSLWTRPSQFTKSYKPLTESIIKKYPFVYNLDINTPNYYDNVDLQNQFMIKHFSICVYGDNIQKNISKFKRNEFPLTHPLLDVPLKTVVSEFKEFDIKKRMIRYVAKHVIRAAFELVHKISHQDVWTRDLYPCYKFFSEQYPEVKEHMKHCLKLTISPTENIDDIKMIVELGYWVLEQLSWHQLNNKYEVVDDVGYTLQYKG